MYDLSNGMRTSKVKRANSKQRMDHHSVQINLTYILNTIQKLLIFAQTVVVLKNGEQTMNDLAKEKKNTFETYSHVQPIVETSYQRLKLHRNIHYKLCVQHISIQITVSTEVCVCVLANRCCNAQRSQISTVKRERKRNSNTKRLNVLRFSLSPTFSIPKRIQRLANKLYAL